MENNRFSEVEFVNLHFVDEDYHNRHSQLVHAHRDVLELFYVLKGEGQYIVGGKKYIVRSGSLVVCNVGVMHGEEPFRSDVMESFCCVLRNVSVPGLPPDTLTQPSQNPVFYFPEDEGAVGHIMAALYNLNREGGHAAECRLLSEALLWLVTEKIESRWQTHEEMKHNAEEFLQNVTLYLDEHYHEPISLKELAERFHISQYYLAHIFKDEIGLSPMKYVLYRRIGESQNLLMNTAMPVGEISDRLGFSDNCHFSTTFKKYVGVTPSQYRIHFRRK